jgi:hypothetical protein
MTWSRALSAYFAWLLAHVVAGAVIAIVLPPLQGNFGLFVLSGLIAGIAFGVAQWLALRPFLPKLRLWAPATMVYSPFSWVFGYLFGFLTLGLGGWLGAGVSALAQWLLLARSTGRLGLSLLWFPASLIGGAIFYFCYYLSEWPSTVEVLFAGSVGYAIVTGLVVALLVTRADHSSAPQPI